MLKPFSRWGDPMLRLPSHNLSRRLASLDQRISELERQLSAASKESPALGAEFSLTARALSFLKAHRRALEELHAKKLPLAA
jgi:hypothetical protein